MIHRLVLRVSSQQCTILSAFLVLRLLAFLPRNSELVLPSHLAHAAGIFGLLKTAVTGAVLGGLAAWSLTECLKRYWIPERLQSPTALMLVVGVFVASHLIQHESGLLSVTVMGLILANQKSASIKHIYEFKENLSVLLISSLFILLSARVEFSEIVALGWRGIAFVLVIILIAPSTQFSNSVSD